MAISLFNLNNIQRVYYAYIKVICEMAIMFRPTRCLYVRYIYVKFHYVFYLKIILKGH